MNEKIKKHYDMLLENGNDPFYDSDELKAYMDKWDGSTFIEKLCLDKDKKVLEFGVGTGRLACRTAPFCKSFVGIDISTETANRCKENLKEYSNIRIICDDFLTHSFGETFDVIYSSLTFMHIKDKRAAIGKVSELLNEGGRFVLSIDKNTDSYIDAGYSKIQIYPDKSDETYGFIEDSGLHIAEHFETELAYIFVADKNAKKT